MRKSVKITCYPNRVPVGSLLWESANGREGTVFRYDDAWLENEVGFQLMPSLPLVSGSQFLERSPDSPQILHGCFADALPNGWGRKLALMADPSLSDADRLLMVSDIHQIGCLSYASPIAPIMPTFPAAMSALPDIMRALKKVEDGTGSKHDIDYLVYSGTALGGMRPKFSVMDEQGAIWVAKFPASKDERDAVLAEALVLTMAQAAGIRTADTISKKVDGQTVMLSRRFDRTARGGRLHYLSARSLLGVTDNDAHAYTEIADAMKTLGMPEKELPELWRRMAFNILVTNVDDHLSNHAFLFDGKGWCMSPAFDLNPFPEKRRVLKLWVSEAHGPDARIENALDACGHFGLDEEDALQILLEITNVVKDWRQYANSIYLDGRDRCAIANAFEHEEIEICKKLLGLDYA